MSVDWTYAKEHIQLGGQAGEIAEADAQRQSKTAEAIISHLRTQPGMILADEVGMGKTYVALAVVASVLDSTKEQKNADPVVIMVPPGLLKKWGREWQRFKAKCTIKDSFTWMDGRDKVATTPTEFFKLLDDHSNKRARLIFVKTSCFAQGLVDPWIKLAFIRYARTHTRMTDEEQRRIHKWADDLTRQKKKGLSEDLFKYLLKTDPTEWKHRLVADGVLDEDADDPVPDNLHSYKDILDYRGLIEVLRHKIPGRSGAPSESTRQKVRESFNKECQALYWQWLGKVTWKALLLVLDEAHHAKNDATRLAGMFRSEYLTELVEGKEKDKPFLLEKSQRMLFLTATPFQLGHDELIRILRSFASVDWIGTSAPDKSRAEYIASLEALASNLNQNRLAGQRLDALWGRLHLDSLSGADGNSEPFTQWLNASVPAPSRVVEEVRTAINECRRSKLAAERDEVEPWNGLSNWVIRHNRPKWLPPHAAEPDRMMIARRMTLAGRSILDASRESMASPAGLAISDAEALPFLLSARAQTELATSPSFSQARAFFAEGLCSSYEAFHHTREARISRDRSERGEEETPSTEDDESSVVPLTWYVEHIKELIPQQTNANACYEHPKIHAVVERAVDLWLSGEKVLIFAFYSQTVKALRNHLRREVDLRLAKRAAERLGIKSTTLAHAVVLRVRRRLGEVGGPFQKGLEAILNAALAEYPSLHESHKTIYHALVNYIRTPAFITRYLPLDNQAFRDAIHAANALSEVITAGIAAFTASFTSHVDGSGKSMRERINRFLLFVEELAMESAIGNQDQDEDHIPPLLQYLDAVIGRQSDDDSDVQAGGSRSSGVVRAVLGETDGDVRERLMLAFNSPLFPDLLVSSSVFGEGVDLHRFCRHIIHHDLCWNPSTLEQRTGRLDRIHCQAEAVRHPIIVYLPFIAGSADEKMFRVVRDRERWFQVVMGQKFEFDERTTEALASRVPLPPEIASHLVFDLTCWRAS